MNKKESPVKVFSTNEETYLKIGGVVARDLFKATCEKQFSIGPLSTNYYSFTFSMRINTGNEYIDIFVKIPKCDMRCITPRILPITPEDRVMAKDEVLSLKILERNWNNENSKVSWVKLLGVVLEHNAIVTKRIFASDAFRTYRYWELCRRIGLSSGNKKLQDSMSDIGFSLARFHNKNAEKTSSFLSDFLPKIDAYCKKLSVRSQSEWPDRIWQELQSLSDIQLSGFKVTTLKGIDIRNVLIDSEGQLYILDPGKTKTTYGEADIARFLMTYRVLFWGSVLLPIVKEPSRSGEQAFLDSFLSNGGYFDPQILNLFLLKEQLKHWDTALESLAYLPWPSIVKFLVERIYVNPFYSHQVSLQLDLIKKGIQHGL